MGELRIVDLGDAKKLIGHDDKGNFILAVSTAEGVSGGYTTSEGRYVDFDRSHEPTRPESNTDSNGIDPVLEFARSAFMSA